MVLIPWDRSIRFDLPIAAWQAMIAGASPQSRLDPARDRNRRADPGPQGPADGSPTFDACVSDLLDEAEAGEE